MIIFQKYFVLIKTNQNLNNVMMKELAKASEDDKPISSDKSKVQISC
jgi:hypothetical protein